MTRFAVVIAVLGGMYLSARSQTTAPLFATATPVVVGRGSGEVILADLDRNGHLDLFTRHLLSKRVTVRLSNSGSFANLPAQVMKFDYRPGAAALGDVNADGILDLAVASSDKKSEKVAIFLGNGRGGFDAASPSTFITIPVGRFYKPTLRLVDMNGDGKADLVAADGRSSTLTVFFGTGRGTFPTSKVVPFGSDAGLYTSAVGDVDGDGHLDIVGVSSGWSGSTSGRVITKRGDGRGAFTDAAGSPASIPGSPRLVALADVNGDGRADVVLGYSGSNLMSVLLSKGDGQFAPASGTPLDLGMETWSAEVADVDADGKADVVVGTVSGKKPWESRIAVLLGDGRGFVPAPGSPFPVGRGSYHLAVGDVNEDHRPDILAASFEGDAVVILFGRSTRTSHR